MDANIKRKGGKMIKWSNAFNAWIFEFTADQITLGPIICENYREAWFFRTYEEDMDDQFVADYLEIDLNTVVDFEAFLTGVLS